MHKKVYIWELILSTIILPLTGIPGLFFLIWQGVNGKVCSQTRDSIHVLGKRHPCLSTVCEKTLSPTLASLKVKKIARIAVPLTIYANCFNISCLVQASGERLRQIWQQGSIETYFSGYAWHNRYTYSKKRLKLYNELAWGGGLGKAVHDEQGNWHGLYAIAFLDSHKNLEPTAGYAFLKNFYFTENLGIGLGYSLLVTSRADIWHGIPFPGALPWVGLHYHSATLAITYIPGAVGAGNVMFLIGKLTI